MSNQIFRSGFNFGLVEAEILDREIQALQRKRDQVISDHLSGIKRKMVGGIEMVEDPSVPMNTVELRDGITGKTMFVITGLGQ